MLRYKKRIILNQRKYALKFIPEMGLSAAKTAVTPLELNHKLTILEYDKVVGVGDDDHLVNTISSKKLIAKLLYVIVTGPKIIYVVQSLSQFMQAPK